VVSSSSSVRREEIDQTSRQIDTQVKILTPVGKLREAIHKWKLIKPKRGFPALLKATVKGLTTVGISSTSETQPLSNNFKISVSTKSTFSPYRDFSGAQAVSWFFVGVQRQIEIFCI
jgi:hypothetical protein